MAETKPKLVEYDKLKKYHQELIEKLGLVQYTGAYAYGGDRTDFPTSVTSIAKAVDEIYDLAKEGAIAFESGKSTVEGAQEVVFNSEDDADTNLYWINAKVGDNVVNIKLDATDFVKDSFLESVKLVTVTIEGGQKTFTPTLTDDEKTAFADKDAGTYFFYTWKVTKGEAETETEYTVISLQDIYGDLKGDGSYIEFDKETSTISAITSGVKIDEETKGYVVEDKESTTHLATAENLAVVANSLAYDLATDAEIEALFGGLTTTEPEVVVPEENA